MANSAGMLKESIWRDSDFRALPRTAQATYAQLLSQKELDRAGMIPLHVPKWSKGCDEITESTLWDDLKLLEARRFVFIDEDTDELFIRSYMRHSEVTKYPQYRKAALRCAGMVASPYLRHEIAVELRRLHQPDAAAKAAEIDPGATVREPLEHGDGTVREPCANPARTTNPSRTLREPSGVREGVGVVTLRSGQVGRGTREPDTTASTPDRDEPPPRFCPKHMPDGTPDACGACGNYGRRRRAFEERQTEHETERCATFWADVVGCPDCDERGLIDEGNRATRCPNHAWERADA